MAGPTEFTIEACPDGGVGGRDRDALLAPGQPGVTLPPTDALDGAGSAAPGDSWRIVLLAMAGLLAAALILTPATAVTRKDSDR